jgi:multiple sugar transport system permease protein
MRASRSGASGLLYVAPALLFVAVFVLYPVGRLAWLSLTNTSLLGGSAFVGVRNYVRAFSDPTVWHALLFTVKYTLYITPILMGLGLLLALLAAEPSRLAKVTRAAVFLPVVIGLGSSSLLWYWLFDQQVGLFNKVLQDLHLISRPIVWFVDAELALWAVILSVVWKVVGFGTILLLAAIQSVGTDINEAALIDGAGYWQRVRLITLPLVLRTLLLTTLVSAIGSMLAFDQFYIMTAGGPQGQTFTSVYWIYQNSFIYFKQGYGAALSLILMLIIMAAAVLDIFGTRRWADVRQ